MEPRRLEGLQEAGAQAELKLDFICDEGGKSVDHARLGKMTACSGLICIPIAVILRHGCPRQRGMRIFQQQYASALPRASLLQWRLEGARIFQGAVSGLVERRWQWRKVEELEFFSRSIIQEPCPPLTLQGQSVKLMTQVRRRVAIRRNERIRRAHPAGADMTSAFQRRVQLPTGPAAPPVMRP